MAQARYHFTHQPHKRAQFEDYLDRTEHTLFGIAGSPELLEPLIVLTGGGTTRDAIMRGCAVVSRMMASTVEQYLGRCDALGLAERRRRSRLPGRIADVVR